MRHFIAKIGFVAVVSLMASGNSWATSCNDGPLSDIWLGETGQLYVRYNKNGENKVLELATALASRKSDYLSVAMAGVLSGARVGISNDTGTKDCTQYFDLIRIYR